MEEWKQSETTYNLRVECCVRKFPVAIQYLVAHGHFLLNINIHNSLFSY